MKRLAAIPRTVLFGLDNSGQSIACCGHEEPIRGRISFGRRNQQTVSSEQDFRRSVIPTLKPARGRGAVGCCGSGATYSRGQRSDESGATCRACAPLSCLFFKNDEAHTGAQGPQVASADSSAKRFRTFLRQILFRKACARMDSRVRLADDGAPCRLMPALPS